jgi:hypothetical protein
MAPFSPINFNNFGKTSKAAVVRHCKLLYCNPGCSRFTALPGSNKWVDKNLDDDNIIREHSAPSYWESVRGNPLANFTDRNSLTTIARLRRKGAKSMCARDANPFSVVNPDWLNKYKLEKFK